MGLKSLVRAVLAHDALVPLWRPLAGNLIAVQTLHRFADPDLGVRGTPVAELRASLAFLRQHRFRIASLRDVLESSAPNERNRDPAIVFTVDDGYSDFANVAAPVFAEFDCPVTVFLVTGALDRTCWYWWDQVEFAVESTQRRSVGLDLLGDPVTWQWETPGERDAAVVSITEALKLIPQEQKVLTLESLAEQLEVDIPSLPPPRYSAMSWEDVRRSARMGATFGPHTVTHPILPAVTDKDAEWEVVESWRRLRSETDAVVPAFAYPSGVYSVREISILARSGLVTALTTMPHYASHKALHSPNPRSRYTVPRFPYTNDKAQFVQVVTGVERLKAALRMSRDEWRPVRI